MLNLEPPDSHHVNAAVGWVELGNPAEARAELERVSSKFFQHPEVLEARWQILAAERRWSDALAMARQIKDQTPDRVTGWINQSFCLHELKRTQEAYIELLLAAKRFPKFSVIPYNLACYACQLGDHDDAKRWLKKAIKIGDPKAIREMALSDPDLAPMHEVIREW